MELYFQTPTRSSVAVALACRDVHLSLPAPVSFKWRDVSPQYKRAPEGATVHGGAVILLKGVVAPPRRCARVPSVSGQQLLTAYGPVITEGRPSASIGRGMKIQGPQCAFETSMFMCPTGHMSTLNLLRSSSTHEPSGRTLSDVSSFIKSSSSSSPDRSDPLSPLERRRATPRKDTPARCQRHAGNRIIVLGVELGFKLHTHRLSPVTPMLVIPRR